MAIIKKTKIKYRRKKIMGWRTKLLYVGLGLAVGFSGLSTLFNNLASFAPAVLLFMSGALLLGQVAWNSLINGKFDEKDITSGVSVVLGVLTIVTGFLVVSSATIPLWLGYVIPWAVVGVSIMLIVQGLRQN
jgi:hypothetical protein